MSRTSPSPLSGFFSNLRNFFRRRLVTREQLDSALADLRRDMATQADIDAITQQVDQVATDLQASTTEIQNELNALAAANPNLDLTALQSAVAPLDAAVVALGQLTPQPSS